MFLYLALNCGITLLDVHLNLIHISFVFYVFRYETVNLYLNLDYNSTSAGKIEILST